MTDMTPYTVAHKTVARKTGLARKDLADLVAKYVDVKVKRGDWWGRTVTVNRRHLVTFVMWLPATPAENVRAITAKHVEAWVHEAGTKHSPAYKRVRLAVLRGFFGWLALERYIDRDPARAVAVPKVPESIPRAFPEEDVQQLFRIAHRDARDLVCVSLCWNEMLRRAEVASVLIEDIDFRRKSLGVRGKGYRGRISRVVPISPETYNALMRYLAEEPAQTGPLVRSRYVPGAPISAPRVGDIIGDVIRDAGLKHFPGDGRSSHAGRHTGAVEALEAGTPQPILQRFLGHTTEAHLARYTRGAVLDLAQVHERRAERREALAKRDEVIDGG